MEQKQSSDGASLCHQLPPLSAKYPWFVSENLGANEDCSRDQYFFTLNDPLTKYQCQIPELLGRRIRGYYHGWVILSHHLQNVTWSLWNPVTSKIIHFPTLILKDGNPESIRECCLSAPPDDPSSVLLITRTNKPTLVFFHIGSKKKKTRWVEMSYARQLKKISGEEEDFLHKLTCCNGKVFALNGNCHFACFVVQLDILAEVKEVIIKLTLFGLLPTPSWINCDEMTFILKGYCTELFIITVGYHHKTVQAAHLIRLNMNNVTLEDMERFKGLDMSSKRWIDQNLDDTDISMELWDQFFDLKDTIFFVDLVRDGMAYYRPGIASELGGYIHIRDRVDDRVDNILYSYHVKEKTMSLSYMPSLVLSTSNVSLWECRFEDDHGGAKCTVDSKQEKSQTVVRSVTNNEIGLHEWNLLNFPFDIIELIIGHCVALEYLNFRATCRSCKLAAPLIQWSNKTSLPRLETYSLVSPWLMVVDVNQGIITFTDPMSGDNYFMKNLYIYLNNIDIYCSRFGWMLFFCFDLRRLFLYNPFTRDLFTLPVANYGFNAACFSAPPTSPDCMVAGFSIGNECLVLIHHVARDSPWRAIRVDGEPVSIHFLTFFGQDLYALDGDGKLILFKELGKEDYSPTLVEIKATVGCCMSCTRQYLMKWDQHLLKVVVGKFGERVEVFKWDVSKMKWEKIDSLGNHMIYLCGLTCLCIEAKTREMANKIYFPMLHSNNKKILHYSLETCTFQTFSGENIKDILKDFFGTTRHLFPHMWIEPSWV